MTDLEELKEKVAGLWPDWKVMSGDRRGWLFWQPTKTAGWGCLSPT